MADQTGWTSPGDSPVPPSAPPPPPPPPGPSWGPPPQPGSPHWGAGPAAQPPRQGAPQWGGGQWGAWSGSPDVKPGVVPLRPLGVGEILDGAITTLRRYPRPTLGLAAVVVTVSQVIQLVVVHFLAGGIAGVTDTGDIGLDTTGSGALVVAAALGFITNVVLTGALAVVIGQAVLGRPIELAETWRALRARLWPLLATAALVLLLDGIALVLLVLPFLFAWPALSLAAPVLMLEREPVGRAISRSVALVRGQFWRCLGVVVLAFLIKSVVGAMLAIPFTLVGGGVDLFGSAPESVDLGTRYLVMSAIGAIVSGTVVAPFSAGVSALLYVDRRMRAEGLDVTLAASAAPAPEPPGSPATAG